MKIVETEIIENPKKCRGKKRNSSTLKKTIVALLIIVSGAYLQSLFSVYATLTLPSREDFGRPLPDVLLDILPNDRSFALWDEFFISSMIKVLIVLLIFHKNRFLMFRRFIAIQGTLFLLRCATVLVTRLSVPNPEYCYNVDLSHFQERNIFLNALIVFYQNGHAKNGSTLCGDLIFSGHSGTSTLFVLFFFHYVKVSKRFKLARFFLYIARGIVLISSLVAFLGLLIGRYHYTVDIVLGIYFALVNYYYYHACLNGNVKKYAWPMFKYLENEECEQIDMDHSFELPFFIRKLCKTKNK